MDTWKRLCAVGDAPSPGNAKEVNIAGVALCLANDGGRLAAVDNICPHRAGPLAEGWIEDGKIVCPWHAWGFDLESGICAEERREVKVYLLREDGVDLLVNLS